MQKLRVAGLIAAAVYSLAAVPMQPHLQTILTANPRSPITLGTQVTLAVVESNVKLSRGESLFFSFAARRAGEQMQLVRRFEKDPKAMWTPQRAGTYSLVVTIEVRRGERDVVSQGSSTIDNYVVTAPASSSSSSPSSTCRAGLTKDAQGRCVDLKTDPFNCGKIGNVCPTTELVCKDSTCQARSACGSPWKICPVNSQVAACVDPNTDPLNCGGCGIRCNDNQNCVNASCRP